ncbi:hypothetical protein Tco_1339238, partial [Tanacetum coccineum]
MNEIWQQQTNGFTQIEQTDSSRFSREIRTEVDEEQIQTYNRFRQTTIFIQTRADSQMQTDQPDNIRCRTRQNQTKLDGYRAK